LTALDAGANGLASAAAAGSGAGGRQRNPAAAEFIFGGAAGKLSPALAVGQSTLEAGDHLLSVYVSQSIIHHVREDYDRLAAGVWSPRNQK
jgi:hypothetical protein